MDKNKSAIDQLLRHSTLNYDCECPRLYLPISKRDLAALVSQGSALSISQWSYTMLASMQLDFLDPLRLAWITL